MAAILYLTESSMIVWDGGKLERDSYSFHKHRRDELSLTIITLIGKPLAMTN